MIARLARRRGYSLVEMLVVIALLAIVLALVGFSLELMLRSVHIVQQQGEDAAQIDRLAAQFRADVHGGEVEPVGQAFPPASGPEDAASAFRILRTGLPPVEYSASPEGRVTRRVALSDGGEERDTFELPEQSRLRLELTSPALATLWIDSPRRGREGTPAGLRSVAIVAARSGGRLPWDEQGITLP